MKNAIISLFMLSLTTLLTAQNIAPQKEVFTPIRLGEVKPQGWIKTQMRQDLRGCIGNLEYLVPDLIQKDVIYGKDRLTHKVKSKDVGALGDTGDWNVQFLWWNSETQSIQIIAKNEQTQALETIRLIPLAKTILRQLSF